MSSYTKNGETWETRNGIVYSYYQDQPCQIIEMRGDFETFKAPETILLHSEPLDDGWSRYYIDTHDPELHANMVELAALYAKR